MTLSFVVPTANGVEALQVAVHELVIAGWTGRDAQAIEHHIVELEAIGVPRPSTVPLFYRVASTQLSQAGSIEVVGAETSGEVEPLLFMQAGETFVSIASDHTDRALETHSVALSKQICAKPVAAHAWRMTDVAGHWDQLILRSWIEEDGRFVLYQEGAVSALRTPDDLLQRCAGRSVKPRDGFAMTCGTVGVIGRIRPAARFRMELTDPVRGRHITHEYGTLALPIEA